MVDTKVNLIVLALGNAELGGLGLGLVRDMSRVGVRVAEEVKLVEEVCGIIGVVNVPLLSTGTADASQGSCADGTERRSHDNEMDS